MHISRSFAPVVGRGISLLILGSLPGEQSLAKQQYYGHPRNQFWRLMGEVVGVDLPFLDYHSRLERLQQCGIGLWDVVESAVRSGSLDQNMRSVIPNALIDLISDLDELDAIAFNGGTASRIGRRQIRPAPPDRRGNDLTLIDLPSSSPANTLPFEQKARIWRGLAAHLRPLST